MILPDSSYLNTFLQRLAGIEYEPDKLKEQAVEFSQAMRGIPPTEAAGIGQFLMNAPMDTILEHSKGAMDEGQIMRVREVLRQLRSAQEKGTLDVSPNILRDVRILVEETTAFFLTERPTPEPMSKVSSPENRKTSSRSELPKLSTNIPAPTFPPTGPASPLFSSTSFTPLSSESVPRAGKTEIPVREKVRPALEEPLGAEGNEFMRYLGAAFSLGVTIYLIMVATNFLNGEPWLRAGVSLTSATAVLLFWSVTHNVRIGKWLLAAAFIAGAIFFLPKAYKHFMEARRTLLAKHAISSTKGNLAAVQRALENYRKAKGFYPVRIGQLTSPEDFFFPNGGGVGTPYLTDPNHPNREPFTYQWNDDGYLLVGRGLDREAVEVNLPTNVERPFIEDLLVRSYDPTNGLISEGAFFRSGGKIKLE